MTANAAAPRIAYLLRMYPRFTQTFVVNEILELERQGMDVRIVSLRKPDEGIFHDSVCRVRAKCDYLPEHLIGNFRKTCSTQWSILRRDWRAYASGAGAAAKRAGVAWFEFVQAAWLTRWARKQGVHHVHVHFGTGEASVAWLARKLGGPRYSLTLHAFDIFRDNVDRRLLAEKINGSEFTVTVCESNRDWMIRNLPAVEPERIRVNYNGVDLSRFTPSSHGGSTREPLLVLSVGRLIEKKGFIHLVNAMGRLRDQGLEARCRIIGDGPEEQRLRRGIQKLGLESSVELAGVLRQAEVREQMQRAACLVLPCIQASDGNVDALPTVLLEAMACGCPVISTRISGVPEIIEDRRSGMLVAPGDADQLAAAMRELLTDAALASALSVDGRRRVEDRFDIERNIRQMRQWLEDACRPKEAAARHAGQPSDLISRAGVLGAREGISGQAHTPGEVRAC